MAVRDTRKLSRGGSRRINKPAEFLTTRFDDLSVIGEGGSSSALTPRENHHMRRPKNEEELMDKERWLSEAMSYGVGWLEDLPGALRSDEGFMKQLVRQVSWLAIKYASVDLAMNPEFVLAARLPQLDPKSMPLDASDDDCSNEAKSGEEKNSMDKLVVGAMEEGKSNENTKNGAMPSMAFKNSESSNFSLTLRIPYRINGAMLRQWCGGSRDEGGAFDEETYDALKDHDGYVTRVQLLDPTPQRATSFRKKVELLEMVTQDSGWLSLADPDTAADPDWLQAAQHRLAEVYEGLPENSPEQLAEQYEGYGALNACLANGGAVLVEGRWLVDYAKAASHGLPRRQDLPSMAIYDGPLFELTTILVLSYFWAEIEEPDRTGERLQQVARIVEWFLKRDRTKKVVVFWDWTALPQHDSRYSCGTIAAKGSYDDAFNEFVDVNFFGHEKPKKMPIGHLKQALEWKAANVADTDARSIVAHLQHEMAVDARIPRDAAEQQLFSEGRNYAHLWYSNVNTVKILLTFEPSASVSRAPRAFGYNDRAWPCFERLLARSISDDLHVFDLGRLRSVDFDDVDDLQALCELQTGGALERMLPMTPAAFSDFIRTKTFCGGTPLFSESAAPPNELVGDASASLALEDIPDLQFLEVVYEKWYEDVIRPSTSLEFVRLDSSVQSLEWNRFFSNILPDCSKLVHLDLHDNLPCTIDISAFASDELRDALGNLKELYLSNTNVYGDVIALANLPKLQTIDLGGTQVSGEVSAFAHLAAAQHILVQSCKLLIGDVEVLKILSPSLKILDVDGCDGLSGNLSRLKRDLRSCTIYYTGIYMHWWKEAAANEAALDAALAPKSRFGSRYAAKQSYTPHSRNESRARTPNLAAFLTGMQDDNHEVPMIISKSSSTTGNEESVVAKHRAARTASSKSKRKAKKINADGSTEEFLDVFEATLQKIDGDRRDEGLPTPLSSEKDETSHSLVPNLSPVPVLPLSSGPPTNAAARKKAAANKKGCVICSQCGHEFRDKEMTCRVCGKPRPADKLEFLAGKIESKAVMRLGRQQNGLAVPLFRRELALLDAAKRNSQKSMEVKSPEKSAAAYRFALPSITSVSKAGRLHTVTNPANPNVKLALNHREQLNSKAREPVERSPRPAKKWDTGGFVTHTEQSPMRGVTPGSHLIASAVHKVEMMKEGTASRGLVGINYGDNEDANEDGIDSSSFEESGEWADGSITPPEGHRDFKSIELSGELCPVVKTPPTQPPTPSTIK